MTVGMLVDNSFHLYFIKLRLNTAFYKSSIVPEPVTQSVWQHVCIRWLHELYMVVGSVCNHVQCTLIVRPSVCRTIG